MGENGGGEVSGGDSTVVFFWVVNALGEVSDLLDSPAEDSKSALFGFGSVG